jgi:hypothetical protein
MSVDQLGRAYQAYRRTAGSRSVALLLVANAIPLIGVVFFGWSLLTILVIYWLENGIVGFWNVPRILLAQGSVVLAVPSLPDTAAAVEPSDAARTPGFARALGAARLPGAGRAALAAFFVVHYGVFWFVHGIFVFALPLFVGGGGSFDGCGMPDPQFTVDACADPMGQVVWGNVAIAGVALFLSHGASFLFNYIGNAEYLTASPARQMGAAYGRVVVLHLTILLGAFAVAFLGAPIAALLVLVVLKTALDLGLHRREHRAAAERVPTDTTFGRIVRGA